MTTNFPGSDDVFTEPDSPSSTTLSSAGTGNKTHIQHHTDAGDALEAMQAQATLLIHSHDGVTTRHGSKLAQANTHQSPDTDSATTALHHTLGTSANQAAAGNHTHTQATSHSSPDTDSATTALHHTLGTSAFQAASGDHVHGHPLMLFIKASTTFEKASYPGLYAIEVELVGGGGGSGYAAATAVDKYSWGVGGSGGAYLKVLILASALTASSSITIGAGGTAGTVSSTSGGTGGTTSFIGSTYNASGGSGGAAYSNIAYASTTYASQSGPGVPSGPYDIGLEGGSYGAVRLQSGIFYTTGVLDGQPSAGPYGVLAKSGYMTDSGWSAGGGTSGKGYGSGASGPFNFSGLSAVNGSAGSAGLCVIRLIF